MTGMRLLIVSHTPHYQRDGTPVGWGPTVRELDYLAELFAEVVHIAPLYDESPPSSALPYNAGNLRFRPVEPAGGPGLVDKARILWAYPRYAAVVRQELSQADAVHVRCPANISLLALAILNRTQRPDYRWVKYAGNWQPDGPDPWFYGLQRRWLTENRHRGVVTVNGRWPDQPPHIHSFYNPCLADDEISQGSTVAAAKQLSAPLELLFVGALNEGKGVSRVLEVALALQRRDIPIRLTLVGDGPDKPRYEAWVSHNRVKGVSFLGWVPRTEMPKFYTRAHVILLPSRSEGWPKVLSEAMAYGAVPIAAAVSSIPQILTETGAGLAFPPDDIEGIAGAIVQYVGNPATWKTASRAGIFAAQKFTYRAYQKAVAGLFARTWNLTLMPPADQPDLTLLVPELTRIRVEMDVTHSPNGHDRH